MSVRPIRSPLVAVVGDHEACLTISSALLRLGQVLGRPVGVKPRMSLVGIDGRTLGSSWRPILADLRSSPDAPARRCTEERDALLRLLECERGLLVAVVVSALGALPDALSGHSAPVHEVVVRGKEDDPANVALSLSRVLLGEERAEVLDHIPARLRPGHRLGLAAVFWDPFRKWDVKRLAEAAGSEARALGRDFAQAALPDPERVCDLFRIAGALSLLEPGKGSAEKLAWRYGFSGAGRIEERCRSLTGFGPQELLAQGASPSELLDVAERLAAAGQQGSCSSAGGGDDSVARVRNERRGLSDRARERLTELHQAHEVTVRQGARSAGADPELQDDVVQHVFARLGGRFTEDPELCERQFTRSYLWRQGRDRVLDYLRSSWHQKRVDAAPDFETWGTESAGSAGDRSSPQVGGISSGWWTSNPETDTTSLRVAMGRLEEPYRWAARLRWGLGWKLDEIAAFLSKSRRRTEQYLSRAKEDVADILRGESST